MQINVVELLFRELIVEHRVLPQHCIAEHHKALKHVVLGLRRNELRDLVEEPRLVHDLHAFRSHVFLEKHAIHQQVHFLAIQRCAPLRHAQRSGQNAGAVHDEMRLDNMVVVNLLHDELGNRELQLNLVACCEQKPTAELLTLISNTEHLNCYFWPCMVSWS